LVSRIVARWTDDSESPLVVDPERMKRSIKVREALSGVQTGCREVEFPGRRAEGQYGNHDVEIHADSTVSRSPCRARAAEIGARSTSAVAAGGDHHIADASQGDLGQPDVLHEHLEGAYPCNGFTARVEHRHRAPGLGRKQLGGTSGAFQELRRLD